VTWGWPLEFWQRKCSRKYVLFELGRGAAAGEPDLGFSSGIGQLIVDIWTSRSEGTELHFSDSHA